MCFSENVSWATLAVAWSGSAALAVYATNPAWQAVAGFFVVVGAMQLWEALLWRERGACNHRNGVLSSAGAINNHLEPVALYVLCVALLKARSPARAAMAGTVMAAYVTVFAILTAEFISRPLHQKCARVTPHGLEWQWNSYDAPTKLASWPYALFLLALLTTVYAYLPLGMDHLLGASIVVTFGVSWVKYRNTALVGSMWCFFAAFLPWVFAALAR
jgi:hypothetical protein